MITPTAPIRLVSDRLKSGPADDAVPFRQAPRNLEAEQALLGAILVNNEAINRVSSFLEPHHFFDPLHQQIFETAAKLIAARKTVTPITLKTFFERHSPVREGLTVPQYLGTLAGNATSIINAPDYARTIKDLADRRAAILMAEQLVEAAYCPRVDLPLSAHLSAARTALDALSREQSEGASDDGLLFAGVETCGGSLAYYIKGLIPADSIIAVYGATTVGKSFWVGDALWHVATGKTYRGRRIKRAPVLYVGLEGRAGIPNRMAALQKQHGGEAWFACLTLPISLGTAEQNAADEALVIQKAAAVAKRYGQPVGVIAIDTFAQAVAGDNENEAATAAAFLARCLRIKTATGATIIFTAHPGKNPALGIRGSSALSPALDTVIRLEREEGAALRTVTLEKIKDGTEGPFGSFTLKQVELGIDDDGDPITSCSVEHVADAQPAGKQKQPKPGSPAALCLEELNQLLISGQGKTVLHDRIPDAALCVNLDEWRTACYAKTICSNDASDAGRRQAFHRAFSALRTKGLVGSHGQHVWKIGVTNRAAYAAPCFTGEKADA